jgi:penicillin-binding protein 2
MERIYSFRKYIVIGIFLVTAVIFIIRLFYMQLLVDKYILSSTNNVLRYTTQYPVRGLIYDRFGKLIVYNEAAYDLMVIPRQVKNVDTAELCRLIGMDSREFVSRLNKARRYSMFKPSLFEAQISRENYGYLEEKFFLFPGFYVQPRTLRKYAYPIAAHTLGYIGEVSPGIISRNPYYRSGDYIGISGLERSYEDILRGKKGMKIRMVDVHNRDMGSFKDGKYDTTAKAGIDLWSSLDVELQQYGELLMTNKKGSIVAIEPSSGEILCMISSPSYNPNLLVGRIRTMNYAILAADTIMYPLFNRALMALYPPGSTFKLIDALIGQQEGVLTPETRYGCPGGFPIGDGKTVDCHSHASPLKLREAVQYSCNTYFCRVFKSIMEQRKYRDTREAYSSWRKHALSLGLGKKLGIDLPNELNGNIPSPSYYDKYFGVNRWRALTVISLAIGQGELGITPVQLSNLSALIANRGWYNIPHVIRAIGKPDSMNKAFMNRKVCDIDPRYFEVVVEGMEYVVLAGTATGARMDSIVICGKTGTAQNPHGKNHSLFLAFAPRENPKIAISVVVENAGYGATWAAPIASLMIEKYITRQVKRKDIEERMISGNLISPEWLKYEETEGNIPED